MGQPRKTVFVSYAPEDEQAAKLICDALKAANFEVWTGAGELDSSIRERITTCSVFVPIISKHSVTRRNRRLDLEWTLADERSNVNQNSNYFISPIYIDRAATFLPPLPKSFGRIGTVAADPERVVSQIEKVLRGDSNAKIEPAQWLSLEMAARATRQSNQVDEARTAYRVRARRNRTLRSAGGLLGAVYPVWFATNRKSLLLRRKKFSHGRANRLTLGRVDVVVPKAHRFGEIGNPFWKRFLRFDLRDDRLKVHQTQTLAREAFYIDIRKAIEAARADSGVSTALVFLHGFNVSFEEAAIRAAQIGFDLKVHGATALFSWPSFGKVTKYAADAASIEASEPYITEFLVDFASSCQADKIHLIAHSMGNRGLLRALQRIAVRAENATNLRFEQIFLAAPDVDRDVFIELARVFSRHSKRTTLYASSHDIPVFLSKGIHSAPRAGYVPPYTVVNGVDTIEVPDFNLDLLGHSYFAQAEALLHDMFDLMQRDVSPAQRQRIEAASDGSQAFWRLRR